MVERPEPGETRAYYALTGLFALALLTALFGYVYWLNNARAQAYVLEDVCPPGHVRMVGTDGRSSIHVCVPGVLPTRR